MRRSTILLSTTVFAFTLAAAARAQSAPPPLAQPIGSAQQRPAGPRAARAARNVIPARAVLRLREQLKLNDDQVKRLEGLASVQTEALRPAQPAQMRVRADLVEARQKDDFDGQRAAIERLGKLRTDMAIARLKAQRDVRDVLTPDQRTRLATIRASRLRRVEP